MIGNVAKGQLVQILRDKFSLDDRKDLNCKLIRLQAFVSEPTFVESCEVDAVVGR